MLRKKDDSKTRATSESTSYDDKILFTFVTRNGQSVLNISLQASLWEI